MSGKLRLQYSDLDSKKITLIHILQIYLFVETSSTLSEHTNDGQEENINLVSMNVEHNGADLKHSKPKPSSKYILTCL